jgi:hypothetical protein
MQQRGHRFAPDHWDTAFEVSAAHKLVRKMAVRSLGTNFAEALRDDLVRRLPGWGKHLAEIGERNSALVDSIVSVTAAQAFVDASKDPNRLRFLREYCRLEPYVIHLVRDSPGFVHSAIKKPEDRMSVDIAIRWWNGTLRHMERLRKTIPAERWLVLRYEDLCANPATELSRVLEFLGVSGATPVLDYRRASHHIIGNAMRLGESSEIRLDASWREGLTAEQRAQIMTATTKYRRIFGYLDVESGA